MSLDSLTDSRLAALTERLLALPASARALLLETLEALQHGERLRIAGEAIHPVSAGLVAQFSQSGRPKALASDGIKRAMDRLGELFETPRPRVVVTGMGAVTAVGHSVEESWQSLLAGQSGIDYVTQFDATGLPSRIAAEVKEWNPARYVERKEARRMARCSQLVIDAAMQAVLDAGLATDRPLGERTGVVLGTGLGGFDLYQKMLLDIARRGEFRVAPSMALGGLPNMPAFYLSQIFGAQGPLNTMVTACAAGTQAVGGGLELIWQGLADRVLVGGVEGLVIESFFATFSAMRAISTRNDPPAQASRPFDAQRDGFIIGEGATVLVLEKLETALERDAPIYAEILGHSASADAYHMAAPEPDGRGAQQAMRWALASAGVKARDIDYINTHGTSTPLNDKTETHAIKQVLGAHAYTIPINSTKSMIGHAFGGAGAIEAMVTIKSVQTDQVHPTINYREPDPDCDLDYVPNHARRHPIQIALSNSFGLGGQNACLVVGKYTR